MGLHAISSTVPSTSASKNIVLERKYINVRNIEKETNQNQNQNCVINLITETTEVRTIHNRSTNDVSGALKQETHLGKDLKVLSNVLLQSNMAPALTEPLNSANTLSSSATSASPRPTSNSQLSINSENYLLQSTTNINGDTNNSVDVETELLRVAGETILNGGESVDENRDNNIISSGSVSTGKIKNGNRLYGNNSIVKEGGGISSPKGAFQLAFEEVIAKQKVEATAVKSSNLSFTTDKRINCSAKAKDLSLTVSERKKNICRESHSRQMGPMCDTNNLGKSQLLEITTEGSNIEEEIQQVKNIDNIDISIVDGVILLQQEKREQIGSSIEPMDLSNYDGNDDSQHYNTQADINSSSSTVTAENTDVEDNLQFTEDATIHVIEKEELQRQQEIIMQKEAFEKSQKTPPRSTSEQQQQQTSITPQSQTSTATALMSLTPQSLTSIGGLSSQRDFIKDSAEMDQVLGDMDLLQVLKGFDSTQGGENLCDLAGSLGLFNDVDVINNYEEMVKDSETREIRNEIERRQQQLQRKCDFLLRRLRKIQARYMGRHTSEEVAGLFEWTNRIIRRKDHEQGRQILYEEDKRRPVSTTSMRSFLKRLDVAATSQHSNQNKLGRKATTMIKKITASGSTSVDLGGSKKLETPLVISTYDEKTIGDIEHVSGMLQTEMREIQLGIDSDVTANSSGDESADEMITYNNQVQQSLSISKRAAWRWARDRSAIASRWTWLLAQISDLEYRIRQHNELHQQIKKNKGAVTFEKCSTLPNSPSSSTLSSSSLLFDQQQQSCLTSSVNGYRGQLPGSSKTFDFDIGSPPPNGAYETTNNLPGACRTRPFQRTGFRKRKLLQTANVHTISKKAARPSTIKCGCQWPLHPCALCTGRSDPTAPRDLPDTMTFSERVALLDAGFHSVLSFPEDVSSSIHMEAVMRLPEWQKRVMRLPIKTSLKNSSLMGSQQQKMAAERGGGDDRSSNKKLTDSRRKYKRKYAQDSSGPAANKKKNSKARRALHNNKFNNSHHHSHTKNSSKYRKLSSNAGATNIIGGMANEYQEGGMIGSVGTNSSSGVTGSSDGIDGIDYGNNHHVVTRSKNSSPTPTGYHNNTSHSRYESRFDRKNRNSYDIDNIVIPYSVAAATRVEILPYKEIPTPKWRIVEDDDPIEQEKTINETVDDEESEDISNLAFQIRHERALLEERKKFQTYLKFPWSTRSRANRRIDSRAESSGANTPDPTSPASNTNVVGDQESIPSPANPSTPQTPVELAEGGDNHSNLQNPITTYLNSVHRRGERKRTVSSKKDSGKEELRRSSSPDGRDIIPPFEPLEFPLSDEKYEDMLRMMPNNHHLLSEDCLKINCDQNTTSTIGSGNTDSGRKNGGGGDCGDEDNDGQQENSKNLSKTNQLNMNSVGDLLSAFDTGDSLMGCDSDTDSAESGLQEEDPNDPEWREPA